MQKIYRNLIIAGTAVVAIGLGLLLYFVFGNSAPASTYSVQAHTGDVTEEINLTGSVKASQGVDMAFESQGKIVANYVKVGDKIYTGEPLVAIDSSLLQSQLQQAQAQLDALSINTVEDKTNVSLQALYANSLSAAQKSVSTAKNILLTISDVQLNNFTGQNQQNDALKNTKEQAVSSLLGQQNAGLWTSQNIAQLNGGAFALVQDAVNNPTQNNIDSALSSTQAALQDVNNMVNAVPIDPTLSSTDRTNIAMAQTSINMEIITTSANIQAIASLKVNNSATITTTSAQIEAAQANINAIKTQISKTVITALFDGQVDKDDVVIGQLVSSNAPVITISNNNLEIDTGIPEINLAQAKVGGSANITLDAFGNGDVFPATIISVDSAPTSVDGVSVYNARLKFNDPNSDIKPGMTANITVIVGTHKNVLLVPKSAVIQKNNNNFVIVDEGNSKKEVRQVNVGLSDNQNIEIISGLKTGEKVFAY